MLTVYFEGWFQCRLANDPDPTDEPRGASGATFAAVNEPDLDRVIRLQKPDDDPLIRSHSPAIGVQVTRVEQDNVKCETHPLVGASVSLLNDARFVEMNGVVVLPNTAFIDPFVLHIEKDADLSIQRAAVWEPDSPAKSYYEVDPALFKPRQTSPDISEDARKAVAESTGITNALDFWDHRKKLLVKERATRQRALQQTESDTEKSEVEAALVAVDQRLGTFELLDEERKKCPHPSPEWDWRARRMVLLLQARGNFKFTLNAKEVKITDNEAFLDLIDVVAEWPVSFWMGAWDNDTLCGYMKGNVQIPTRSGISEAPGVPGE